jgi:uncharacterized membrane protein required for colicin V production
MWLDGLLVGLLALFALLGAWRGALESGLRLLGLTVAYGGAVWAATRLGPALGEELGLSPLLAMPLAGTAAFLGCQLLFHVALVFARATDRERRAGAPRGAFDRALGAFFGVARGAVFAILLAWLGLVAGALRETRAPVAEALPDTSESALAKWSGRLVGAGTRTALGGDAVPGAGFAGTLVADPADTLAATRRVLSDPAIIELQRDAQFWALVEAGAVERALALPSFRSVAGSPELRAELARLGVIDEFAAATPAAFTHALAPALLEVGHRVAGLRSDPEVQQLLRDPEVARLLEQGDTLGLLTHPAFQDLVRRVTTS